MTTLMNQLQARIETAVNKTGTYNEALQNLADLYGVPQGETGSRLIPVVQSFDPTINNATAAQNYLLYNSSIVSGGVPSLGLDFTSGTLDSRITFTRASTATRVNASGLIESVAINAPRFDYDPVSRAPKGLLVEEQRTNLLTYSEQFENAAWTKTRSSILTNAEVAPDGTLSADKLVEDTTVSNTHIVSQTLSSMSAGTYTTTVYAKAGERTRFILAQTITTGNNATFNLSTGTVAGTPSNCTATITLVGNGWYRCSITYTTAATQNITTVLYLDNGSSNSYTGDGTSGIFVWGAQLEAGSFATSYIPTVAAQVTRSTDNASMTGTNFSSWYNATEGTWVVETGVLSSSATVPSAIFVYSDFANFLTIAQNGAFQRYWIEATTGTQVLLDTQAFSTAGTKTAAAYKANNFAYSTQGAAASTDASGTVPSFNQMLIGSYAGVDSINGHIRRIMYYNTRLTNAQLQALTS